MPSGRRTQAGFTLLELVAALAIFALVAVMAYGGLISVIETRQQVGAAQEEMARWQRGAYRLRADLESVVGRSVRDDFGDTQPALYINERGGLEFTRGGYRNPLDLPRSGLQRVEYLLRDGALLRSSWQHLERVQGDEPSALILLDGIEDLRWRFLGDGEEWQEQWPPVNQLAGAPASLPRAVELIMVSKRYGELNWLYAISGGGA